MFIIKILFLDLPSPFLILFSMTPLLSLLFHQAVSKAVVRALLSLQRIGAEFWSHEGNGTKISVGFGRAIFQTNGMRELGFTTT